jgi:L-fuculose-phosphate aldolase
MSALSYLAAREEMVAVARSMWNRRLTNAAGGNFAVRVEDNRVLITPSRMSEEKHCALAPEDLLLIDFEQNILEGAGDLSRETDMHVALLRGFSGIGAVIHAHPFYCMAFVAQSKPIPSMIEATMERGEVGCIPYTKVFTPQLAENVTRYFEARRDEAKRHPVGVILPLHGLVVSGAGLRQAYSMLECIECDAFCAICKPLI